MSTKAVHATLGSLPLVMLVTELSFALISGLIAPASCWAHGFAGQRFFPATLTIDDPFVADEGNILFGHSRTPNDTGGNVTTNSTEIEFAKRITPDFGLSLGTEYDNLQFSNGDPSQRGYNNLNIGAKYLTFVDASHETLMSVGLNASLGSTGSSAISDSFSTISPAFFFGKGFGDLPSSLEYLRPLAITGAISPNFTTQHSAPDSLNWGFTFQYSLQYLQSFVKDVGIGHPFNHMIPVVETPMNTCLNQGCANQTTGTINPGVIWFSRWGQLALEGTIPVNQRTGSHVGLLFQVHFYFDDIFPNTLGKPLIK
ncbi:MAG: hypothetical protein LAN63_19260 [Acidobacteriia bacterium]|nr:hypothetical protein [Terriglobia bacterium]